MRSAAGGGDRCMDPLPEKRREKSVFKPCPSSPYKRVSIPPVSAARSSNEDSSSAVTSLSAGKALATRTTSVPLK